MGKAVAVAVAVLALAAAAVDACAVDEITVTGESARSAVVRWSSSCSNVSFALRSSHVQFRACGPETPNDPAQFTSIRTNDTWHRLEDLHPFSEYNVEVAVVGAQTADRPKVHSVTVYKHELNARNARIELVGCAKCSFPKVPPRLPYSRLADAVI
jgi:hypothetical protein